MIARASGWVYLVSDRRRLLPSARTNAEHVAALEAQIEEAVTAGVDVIQLRERDLDGGLLCSLARRAIRRAAGTTTRILINDRADVAVAAHADGIHLRGDGPAIARVRTSTVPNYPGRVVERYRFLVLAACMSAVCGGMVDALANPQNLLKIDRR